MELVFVGLGEKRKRLFCKLQVNLKSAGRRRTETKSVAEEEKRAGIGSPSSRLLLERRQ